MARGVKTDEQMIAKIMTSYALTNSYNATAKELGISDTTVKTIIEKHKEEFGKVKEQKKEEFSTKANIIIDKQLELLNRRVDNALINEDELDEIIMMVWEQDKKELNETQKKAIVNKISKMQLHSLSEITTSLGTLYDKMRLAKGESTSNENIVVSMSPEIKELSE